MEKNNSPEMPDFDSLDDRMIAEAPSGPFLGIKTNLDIEDPEKYNPYKQRHMNKPSKENLAGAKPSAQRSH